MSVKKKTKKGGAAKVGKKAGSVFEISKALGAGFENTKKYFWKVLGFFILTEIIMVLLSFGFSETVETAPVAGVLFWLAQIYISILFSIGWMKTGLAAMTKKKLELKNFFNGTELFWKYIIVSIVVSLIVLAGFILFVVPGILWALMFWPATLLVVDKKLGLKKALAESRKITKGSRGKLFLFGLSLFGINILGAMVFGLGLFLTVPMSFFAVFSVYGSLIGKKA